MPLPGSGPVAPWHQNSLKDDLRSVMQEMMIPADGVDCLLLLLGGPNCHDRPEQRIR